MASIRKRGKTWEARISYKTPEGKYKTKTKSGFKTKKEAVIFANENEVLAITGELATTKPKLFTTYFKDWYELYKEPTIRDRTKLTYKQAQMNLEKYLPDILLQDMDRQTYQKFLNEFGAAHSKATVSKMNSLYHAAVKDAVYDKLIYRDFIQGTKMVYNDSLTRKIDYLNIEEMKKLINFIMETKNPHFPTKYMILTALLTGMRPGEIAGLTWDNINFAFKTITVEKSWNDATQDFQLLKNESSNRILRVDDFLLDTLKELPKDDPQKRLFVYRHQSVPTSSAVNKLLKESLKELAIDRKGFHFHSCRHTHVAYLLSSGIDIYAISKRLGHNNITITAKVYAYLIDEYKAKTDENIINALGELIPEKKFGQVLSKRAINIGVSR